MLEEGSWLMAQTLLDKLDEIIDNLEKVKRDAEKADGGNKSAATRMRKDVMSAAKELRELRQISLEKEKD